MDEAPQRTTAYLGLGSNLGDRLTALRTAVDRIRGIPATDIDPMRDVAGVYESAAIGGPADQSDYLNTVVRIGTTLNPHELLRACQAVESQVGRVPGERWGPRIMDIDILLVGELVIDEPGLTIPHPRMCERRFVIAPLCELAADRRHPLSGLTVGQIAAGLSAGQVAIARVMSGAWATDQRPLLKTAARPSMP